MTKSQTTCLHKSSILSSSDFNMNCDDTEVTNACPTYFFLLSVNSLLGGSKYSGVQSLSKGGFLYMFVTDESEIDSS